MWPQMSSSLAIRAMLHWDFHLYPYMSCLWMIWVNLTRFRDRWFFPLPFNAMVTKMTWPQAIDIKKIRDLQVVCIHAIIASCKLQVILSPTVTLAWCRTSKSLIWGEVTLKVTWGCDLLRCVKKREMRKNDQRTAMPIFTVLASPFFFFLLSSKTLRGRRSDTITRSPVGAWDNTYWWKVFA